MYEDMVDAVESMQGLGDLGAGLDTLERADLGDVNMKAKAFALMRKRLQSLKAKRKAQTGGLHPDEVKGLVPIPSTLYCRRKIANGAIAANTEFTFFHKGIDDDASVFGFTGTVTERHTNLQREGRLAQDEKFVCTGLSLQFPSNIAIADLEQFARGIVRWEERSGSTSIVLGTVEEFPRVYGPDLEFSTGLASGLPATNGIDRNPHFIGPKYVFRKPLFIIRGELTQADQQKLIIKFFEAWSPNLSADTEVTARLHGVHYKVRSGRR